MKKNVVLGLLVGSCLVSACVSQYPLNNNGIDEVKIIKYQGKVEVKVNTGIFPKKAFSTKAVDFSNTEIKKLKFSVLPLGTGTCATELTTSIDWTAGTPINTSLANVPLGKAFLSLHALDVDGKIISSLHGMLDVVAGSNTAKLSIFESTVAQVFMQWLSCTDENKALWQKVSIADVRNLIKAETGYDETTNKFTKINPTSLDIIKIASNILQNNGSLPATGTITNIEGSSSVNVNISEIGVSVSINDLTSTSVTATTSNTVAIPNVSFGKWLLTVRKEGFQTYQTEFTANGTVNLPNIQLMPLVVPTPTPTAVPTATPLPTPIETPLPTPTPTSIPIPTPTPSAVLTEVTITTVPDEKMLIDGYEDDWTGINPVMTDATNNGYPDLTALYLAIDSEYLYYKFDAVEKVSISSSGAWDAGFSLRLKENSSIDSEGDVDFRAFNLTNEAIDQNNLKYSIAYPAIMFRKIINGVSTPLIPTQPYISSSIYRHSYFISKKGVCEGKILLSELGNINNKEVSWGYFTGSNNPKKFKIVNFSIPTFNPFITNAILFTKEIVGSSTSLYIISEDGTKERKLIDVPAYNATWSPDGTKILYDAGGSIFTINKDGSSIKTLITSDTFYNASYPAWSPDGSKIVFSGKKTNISNGQIFTMNSDGTNIVQISNFVPIEPDKVETTCTKPFWSPDGSKISYVVKILSGSFSGQDAYNSTGSYIVNTDGTNTQKSPYAGGGYFRWSPNGTKIAYVTNSTSFGLYAVSIEDLNTKETKSIDIPNSSSNTGNDGNLLISWSKDSKKIAVESVTKDLFVINTENLTITNITNTKAISERSPSWRPY